LNILVVSQYYWPESIRINDFIFGLKKTGCKIYILTGQPNYPEGRIYTGYSSWKLTEELHNQIKIYRVPIFPRGKNSVITLALNYLSFIISGSIFGAYKLRNHKFDFVLTYGTSPIFQSLPAIFIAYLKSAKRIIWIQDIWPDSLIATGFVKSKNIILLVKYAVKWIYSHSDLILVQSRSFIPCIKKLSINTKIKYFPQPGERSYRGRFYKLNSLKLKDGFNVIFAGNMGTVQSLDTILNAAKILKNDLEVNFYLVGSGRELKRISNKISKEKIKNVKLLGKISPEYMHYIYKQASVLLITLSDFDSLNRTIPGKLQTYLAQSKPIIASMNGEGARIISESKSGIVCAAEDSEALAKAVIKLKSTNKKTLKKMAANAFNYYKANFDIDLLSAKFIKIIKNIK